MVSGACPGTAMGEVTDTAMGDVGGPTPLVLVLVLVVLRAYRLAIIC